MLLSAITGDGITKTKMMYSSYLSYPQLKVYLSFMIANKLLEYDSGNGLYKITSIGLEFLDLNNRINNMFNKSNNDILIPSIRY
jgi:predicted transcriptional regulator